MGEKGTAKIIART